MSNETKLGLGRSTGMFYHAAAGTALPTSPADTLPQAWTLVGDVTEDGITLTTDKSTENLRNWALVIKRVIMTEHTETVQCPIMDTTEEVLKTCLGADNVTVTAANASHGKLVNANLSPNALPPEEAYLWIMKDGDDLMAIGCSRGQITSMENIAFQPAAAINWTPTITAEGDGFQLIMDDGQTTT